MKFAGSTTHRTTAWASLFTAILVLAPAGQATADNAGAALFQKPNRAKASTSSGAGVQFRPASAAVAGPVGDPAAPSAEAPVAARATGNPLRAANAARVVGVAQQPSLETVSPAQAGVAAPASPAVHTEAPAAARQARAPRGASRATALPSFAQPGQDLGALVEPPRSRAIAAASIQPWIEEPAGAVQQAGYCDCGEPACGICEPGCGIEEPGCGIVEAGCGMEPQCGIMEPGCGLEPTCGCGEPSCGIVGCGSCVGNPGPDYWCFPVCLPRFKDLRFWAGVHGFKGPRDSPAFGGAGDGNFGFQEGFNIGGRAPLVSLLFPQLSYQLGYQAVQSQLSGLSDGTTSDRSQQFVTAGVFRRVESGVQFGAVFDVMRDDFQMEEDFHQVRYEISLKSRAGREFGFWGASHTNDATVAGINYEAVDQYCGFFRCHFREGGAVRFWGGATNDSEGLFGADFMAPLNNRWSIQTGFNYLITDAMEGAVGAREESWNVGLNFVWHYGLTGKKGQSNPHAPLFQTADNGWFFLDQAP